jgi:hypothetical protein
MKLIQILVLVAALAAAATAQSTSSTSTGSGAQANGTANQKKTAAKTVGKSNSGKSSQSSNQTSGVKLIVPKGATKTNASGAGSSSAKHANTAAQKAPVLVVKPAPKRTTNAKSAAAAPAKKTADKKAPVEKKSAVKMVQKTASETKSDDAVPTSITASGRRDPFLSIIRSLPTTPAGPSCSVGKRCLFIPELELKGIAKDTDGQMMAVVMSNTHRAYFLRENDQVFNGSVQKITSDSVVFREFVTDHLGRETAHEVVKKLPRT